MATDRIIEGHIVDVINSRIIDSEIVIEKGRISRISQKEGISSDAPYLLPGFIDAHVHIESSMLLPTEFAKMAVRHGTVGAVADPHEIANVVGIDGVDYMIDDGKRVTFHFCFGAPSCVPATNFETSGARLDTAEVTELLQRDDIHFLSEMMNFPGVLGHDAEVWAKLAAARATGKPVDGHAPGLRGDDAIAYIDAGISTDHECSNIDEAKERIMQGMKILIREGSAAKNFDALIPLVNDYADRLMFCSDDKHPDELVRGHINVLVKRAIDKGYPLWNVLRTACLNPVKHYKMDCGLLREGDSADFIAVDNLEDFNILSTTIAGTEVYSAKKGWCPAYNEATQQNVEKARQATATTFPNKFNATPLTEKDIELIVHFRRIKAMKASNGELFTQCVVVRPIQIEGVFAHLLHPDPSEDLLKLVVYNRYEPSHPQVTMIKGFGLKKGALASTIAHDSHNLIAVGATDADIVKAINTLIDMKGGIAVSEDEKVETLPLPIAGLMSPMSGEEVAHRYQELNDLAHHLGTTFSAPFMTLAFMALLVIPELKLSDKGLFDVTKFAFTNIEAHE
jgi:adenine deaminase